MGTIKFKSNLQTSETQQKNAMNKEICIKENFANGEVKAYKSLQEKKKTNMKY